jgi:hypothetical protein
MHSTSSFEEYIDLERWSPMKTVKVDEDVDERFLQQPSFDFSIPSPLDPNISSNSTWLMQSPSLGIRPTSSPLSPWLDPVNRKRPSPQYISPHRLGNGAPQTPTPMRSSVHSSPLSVLNANKIAVCPVRPPAMKSIKSLPKILEIAENSRAESKESPIDQVAFVESDYSPSPVARPVKVTTKKMSKKEEKRWRNREAGILI